MMSALRRRHCRGRRRRDGIRVRRRSGRRQSGLRERRGLFLWSCRIAARRRHVAPSVRRKHHSRFCSSRGVVAPRGDDNFGHGLELDFRLVARRDRALGLAGERCEVVVAAEVGMDLVEADDGREVVGRRQHRRHGRGRVLAQRREALGRPRQEAPDVAVVFGAPFFLRVRERRRFAAHTEGKGQHELRQRRLDVEVRAARTEHPQPRVADQRRRLGAEPLGCHGLHDVARHQRQPWSLRRQSRRRRLGHVFLLFLLVQEAVVVQVLLKALDRRPLVLERLVFICCGGVWRRRSHSRGRRLLHCRL
mmetsp:Transcript_22782/g.69997  ORF Transcript_22782/g.69997 Transcript_22782/m.69997 type:complete len:306 (+) Transcript_22782:2980-3897(+)